MIYRELRISMGIWLAISLCLPISLVGQQKLKPADFGIKSKKALKLYQEGLIQDGYRDRLKAIEFFQAALELEPDFVAAHYHLGKNAYLRMNFPLALPHLQTAYEADPDYYTLAPLMIGESYFFEEQYAEAIDPLETFLANGFGRERELEQAITYLKHARFAAEAIKDSVTFDPTNLGIKVNSPGEEYFPFLTADGQYMLFTSRRPESMGGYNAQFQGYGEDFFYCVKEEGEWQTAQNLGRPINTVRNEGAASITQDGKMIFFAGCNRPEGFGSCDIYYAIKSGNRWSEPKNLGPRVNSKAKETNPFLSDDGKQLYFSSSRPGGLGGADLWVSEWNGEYWEEPTNLGPSINTPGSEISPFLHADGKTLYFASDYHPGFGAQDLFMSNRQSDGSWGTPRNLGYPLNTSADESNIFVETNGKQGYINSDREGGLGSVDLYGFVLDKSIRPKTATYLRGVIVDSLTEKPIAAQIRLLDVETGDTVRLVRSDKVDGKFLASLPLERAYAAIVEAPGYLFASKSFFLKDLPDTSFFDIYIELTPVQAGKQVVLRNIFFDFGSFTLQETSEPELKVLLNFMKQNPEMKIEIQGHTDDVGSADYNLQLSQSRAESVRTYLIDKGIKATRISAKGYGETQPVAGNITEEDRAMNRRTEFKILSLR